ncbi:hypothetical protein J5N97_006379 [Dioscorea zingiberensis]|uniref:DDE Tnp4 domain-containing protein n=1 Tax=Dioscorea zingiberensis TaxID=325984 RepID=A0A9D5HTC0_9LILI|nr:hypothetical protein J5N97_006379 [Dioscorea zingiberensis]
MDNNMEISEEIFQINRLLHGDDTTSINMVRMKKLTFFNLASILRSRGLLKDSTHASVEEQLFMFLCIVGHNQRDMVIGHTFLRSSKTVSRYFNHVLWAIGQIQGDYIKPHSTSVSPYIAQRPNFYYPYFKDCIGALDGTHIHANVPIDIVEQFCGRKSFPTQKVLAAVDFDLCFTYVLAGWEGSANDTLVLRDALNRSNGLKVPEGKYYLAGAGYTTQRGFISPYKGVRYQSQGSRTPNNPKELFNYRHFSAHTSIERAFGSLKSRFKILTSRPFFPLKTQVDIVLACCTLHNYILTMGVDDLIPTEEEWVSQSETSATSREQGQAHPECNLSISSKKTEAALCAAFLSNYDSGSYAKVTFNGLHYDLPPWSISILPDCKTTVFNTAKVGAQTTQMKMLYVGKLPLVHDICHHRENEQFLKSGQYPYLTVYSVGHSLIVFVNGQLAGTVYGSLDSPKLTYNGNVEMWAGRKSISLLSIAVGLPNVGNHFET